MTLKFAEVDCRANPSSAPRAIAKSGARSEPIADDGLAIDELCQYYDFSRSVVRNYQVVRQRTLREALNHRTECGSRQPITRNAGDCLYLDLVTTTYRLHP